MWKFAIAISLLVSPAWADSVSGTVEVTGQSIKPLDVIVFYDRSERTLDVRLCWKTMSLDEKKYVAANINLLESFAGMTIPVQENRGKLTVRQDGTFETYHSKKLHTKFADWPLTRRSVTLKGTLEDGVQIQTTGSGSGVSWNLDFDAQILDPLERKIKLFPNLELGENDVTVSCGWESTGEPYVSFGGGSKKGHTSQQLPADQVRKFIDALRLKKNITYRSIGLSNESGLYVFHTGGGRSLLGKGPDQVTLDAETRTKIIAVLRAAAQHVHMSGF